MWTVLHGMNLDHITAVYTARQTVIDEEQVTLRSNTVEKVGYLCL